MPRYLSSRGHQAFELTQGSEGIVDQTAANVTTEPPARVSYCEKRGERLVLGDDVEITKSQFAQALGVTYKTTGRILDITRLERSASLQSK